MSNKSFGIDLGTTNSAIACSEKKLANVVPCKSGKYLLPSIVNVNQKGEFVVGETAKNLQLSDPLNTFLQVKRLIGVNPENNQELSNLIDCLQFCVKSEDQRYILNCPNSSRDIECQEISAQILMQLHQAAQKYDPNIGDSCVVTVPAYFNNRQRVATKEAVDIAGLRLLQLINEPTAAAIAYGFHQKDNKEKNILVADLGGGTFDLSLVEKDSDNFFFVVATLGDTQLGGEDFTNLISEYLKTQALQDNSDILIEDPRVISQFKSQAELLKCEVSLEGNATASFPFLPLRDGKTHSFEIDLDKKTFEEICEPLIKKIEETLLAFLEIEEVKDSEIDEVVLAGGSSRLPAFQEAIKRITGKNPKSNLNPDLLVAQGAAICAELYSENQPIQTLMCDVTPLTLGTDVIGDEYAKIIPANTPIPCSRTENFTTVEDYQEVITVDAYQGERLVASENIHLGGFLLDGIEIAQAQIPSLDITFSIDIDGILNVYCVDNATGANKEIKIKGSGNLSPSKIKELKKLASIYKNKDKKTISKNKSNIDRKNELDKLILLAERKKYYSDMSDIEKLSFNKAKLVTIEDSEEFIKSEYFSVFKNYLNRPSLELNTEKNVLEEQSDELEAEEERLAQQKADQLRNYERLWNAQAIAQQERQSLVKAEEEYQASRKDREERSAQIKTKNQKFNHLSSVMENGSINTVLEHTIELVLMQEKEMPDAITSDYILLSLMDDFECNEMCKKVGLDLESLVGALEKVEELSRTIFDQSKINETVVSSHPILRQFSSESINVISLAYNISEKYNQNLRAIHILLAIACYQESVQGNHDYVQVDCAASILIEIYLSKKGILEDLKSEIYSTFMRKM